MSRVLAISGSLRAASYHTQLLSCLQPLAPEGMHIALFSGLGELPYFSEDLETDPPVPVRELWQAIADADGLIIATPEATVPARSTAHARAGGTFSADRPCTSDRANRSCRR